MVWSGGPPPRLIILSKDQREALPPAYRLESTILHLQDKGELRTLIGIVERWAQHSEPTPDARIAQARALLRLGMVDPAWARLQSLSEAEGASAEVLALTIEMFLVRQWPKRARKVLRRGLEAWPDDVALKLLWERLSEAQTEPDLGALDNQHADVSALLTTAHHLVATGSHTRARTLLERARQLDPDNVAAQDMLWALDGDYLPTTPLAELIEAHGPDLGMLADLDEEPDHTESAAPDGSGVEDRDLAASGFPELFREQGARTEMLSQLAFEDSDEITKVSSMLDLPPLDPLSVDTGSVEHTEIQRVITKQPQPISPLTEPTFDLSPLGSDLNVPEVEDDEVVVLTRRDDEPTETEIHSVSDVTDDLILDVPAPEPDSALAEEEAETWILPQVVSEDPPTTARSTPATPSPPSVSWWLVALVTALAAASVLFVLLLVFQVVVG